MNILGKHSGEELSCSFCGRQHKDGAKLISSPSERPRAYICDECIAVCSGIVQDDQATFAPVPAESESPEHAYEKHPRVAELLDAVERWVHEESLGKDGLEALEHLRTKARQIARDIAIGAGRVRGV